MLLSDTLRIDALETAGTLHDRLAALGARMVVEAVDGLARGALVPTAQPEDGVTYAKKIRPREAYIDWSKPAEEVDRRIRGLSPFPGAWFMAPSDKGPTRIKALLSRTEDVSGEPGCVLDDALLIACGSGAVRLLRAQREGKSAQDAETFLRGFKLPAGARLG